MKYRLFVWSTHMPHDTAQGIMDFAEKDAAMEAYNLFLSMGMAGKDRMTCIELYTLDENDESDELLYSASFAN